MEEHVQHLMAKLPRADALQYAIDTLEIEWGRLTEAVRAMRALPITADDYPEKRANEQSAALKNVEQAIVFLRQAVETSEREHQLKTERWEQQADEWRRQADEREKEMRARKASRRLQSLEEGEHTKVDDDKAAPPER
jgi:hypothetical protein